MLLPVLETSGARVGEDFFLAYSPEREDPGNALHSLATYYYCPEDGPRAVPEWERIVSTMRLGTCPDRGDAAPPRISN